MALVLYVENSPGLVLFVKQVITSSGFDFEASDSSAHAIGRLELDPLPDLVICDLLLNDNNGIEVLEHLMSARFDDVPVIVLTGSTREAASRSLRATKNYRYYPIAVKPSGMEAVRLLFSAILALYLDERWQIL